LRGLREGFKDALNNLESGCRAAYRRASLPYSIPLF